MARGASSVIVVYQTPPATTKQFAQDVQAVRDDFARIKQVVERTRR
jgi:hypothetical protein